MTWEREITVEGTVFRVTISDDCKALHSAYAEGRAVVGLWDPKKENQSLAPAAYVVEKLEDIDDIFLERVVRRRLELPWIITRTNRLTVRELVPQDCLLIPDEPEAGEEGRRFLNKEYLKDYIRCQYGFYEYGIWALEESASGRLVGKVGLSNLDLSGCPELSSAIRDKMNSPCGQRETLLGDDDTPVELGYHIFSLYRNQGYAREACQAILQYGAQEVSGQIYARIERTNLPSLKLAESLGFRLITQGRNGPASDLCLYGWNCR
ncbi:MAG: GNAT family N-acetyltransferase [Lacrimispora sp.]